MTTPPTPTADVQILRSVDPTTGTMIVEFGTTPDNDLALVAGIDRLVQDIERFLFVPPTSLVADPDYGNPLWELLGEPMGSDLSAFYALITEAENAFLVRQEQDAALGYRAQDELVDAFTDQIVTTDGTGGVTIAFTVRSKGGSQAPITLTY